MGMRRRNKAQSNSGYLNCIPKFDLTNIIILDLGPEWF
jgi:hypothetical protein